jgi:hypothetical protein
VVALSPKGGFPTLESLKTPLSGGGIRRPIFLTGSSACAQSNASILAKTAADFGCGRCAEIEDGARISTTHYF